MKNQDVHLSRFYTMLRTLAPTLDRTFETSKFDSWCSECSCYTVNRMFDHENSLVQTFVQFQQWTRMITMLLLLALLWLYCPATYYLKKGDVKDVLGGGGCYL